MRLVVLQCNLVQETRIETFQILRRGWLCAHRFSRALRLDVRLARPKALRGRRGCQGLISERRLLKRSGERRAFLNLLGRCRHVVSASAVVGVSFRHGVWLSNLIGSKSLWLKLDMSKSWGDGIDISRKVKRLDFSPCRRSLLFAVSLSLLYS